MFGKTSWNDDWSITPDDRTIIVELPHANKKYQYLFFQLETREQAKDLEHLLISLFWRSR